MKRQKAETILQLRPVTIDVLGCTTNTSSPNHVCVPSYRHNIQLETKGKISLISRVNPLLKGGHLTKPHHRHTTMVEHPCYDGSFTPRDSGHKRVLSSSPCPENKPGRSTISPHCRTSLLSSKPQIHFKNHLTKGPKWRAYPTNNTETLSEI